MIKWYQRFFFYLDRYFCKYNEKVPIYEYGMSLFKEIILNEFLGSITNCLLKYIYSERNGNDFIDHNLIKECVNIYIEMDVYEEFFEKRFLNDSLRYFNSKLLTQEETITCYLLSLENIFIKEKRISNYLKDVTVEKLFVLMNNTLITNQINDIIDHNMSLYYFLQNDCLSDISRMYHLFSVGTTDNYGLMALIYKSCIIKSIKPSTYTNQNNYTVEETDQIMSNLCYTYHKYHSMLINQFQRHSVFERAFNDGFNEIINNSGWNFTEVINFYCDKMLKIVTCDKLTEKEIDCNITKAIVFFNYIIDKDIFAVKFCYYLSRRLLNQRSSRYLEENIIGKMKRICGSQYTYKMESMINDFYVMSKEESDQFLSIMNSKCEIDIEFNVNIITNGNWPKIIEINGINIPPLMQKYLILFEDYYRVKRSLRCIKWIYSLGTIDLLANFKNGTKILIVTTLQAFVLLQFNEYITSQTFQQLRTNLNISEDILKKILHSLCCGKFEILRRTSEETGNRRILNTDYFCVNDDFICKQSCFRIPMSILEENNQEKIEHDRSVNIEATIVRIMKSRKCISHQNLVEEIFKSLTHFHPDLKVNEIFL